MADTSKTNSGWTREQARKMGEATEQSVKDSGQSSAEVGTAGEKGGRGTFTAGQEERSTGDERRNVGEARRLDPDDRPDEGAARDRSEDRPVGGKHAGEAAPTERWAEALREKAGKIPTNNT